MTRVGEVLKNLTIKTVSFGIEVDDVTSTLNLNSRQERQLKTFSTVNEIGASEAQALYLIWILKQAKELSSNICLSSTQPLARKMIISSPK